MQQTTITGNYEVCPKTIKPVVVPPRWKLLFVIRLLASFKVVFDRTMCSHRRLYFLKQSYLFQQSLCDRFWVLWQAFSNLGTAKISEELYRDYKEDGEAVRNCFFENCCKGFDQCPLSWWWSPHDQTCCLFLLIISHNLVAT